MENKCIYNVTRLINYDSLQHYTTKIRNSFFDTGRCAVEPWRETEEAETRTSDLFYGYYGKRILSDFGRFWLSWWLNDRGREGISEFHRIERR